MPLSLMGLADRLPFGVMHIRAIMETGGQILGERSLENDEITLPMLLSATGRRRY